MAAGQLLHQRRRDAPPTFNSTMYYKLSNVNRPGAVLSAGVFQDTQGALNMTLSSDTLTSENWQLFYQSGRYFIRNFDYGAGYQLGLTSNSESWPRLYPRNGKVEQQWSIQPVDGGYELVNGLWGNGTSLNIPKTWLMPAMNSDTSGRAWNITANPTATKLQPISGEMLTPVQDFEVLSPSPTPTTTENFLVDFAPPPSTLSVGAIAGIALGCLLIPSALLSFLFYFFIVRKRRHNALDNTHPYKMQPDHHDDALKSTNELPSNKAMHRAELPTPPVELMEVERETVVGRVELDAGWDSGFNSPVSPVSPFGDEKKRKI